MHIKRLQDNGYLCANPVSIQPRILDAIMPLMERDWIKVADRPKGEIENRRSAGEECEIKLRKYLILFLRSVAGLL